MQVMFAVVGPQAEATGTKLELAAIANVKSTMLRRAAIATDGEWNMMKAASMRIPLAQSKNRHPSRGI